jgi:hypothetical protein
VGGTAHVHIDPVSNMEISAKHIRNRISFGSFVHVDSPSNTYGSVSEDSAFRTPVTTPTSPATPLSSFHSINEAPTTPLSRFQSPTSPVTRFHSLNETSFSSTPSVAFRIHVAEAGLVLGDDCVENPVERDECLRLTARDVTVTAKAVTTERSLRCLANFPQSLAELDVAVGAVQIDNQMFRKGAFDFPVVVYGSALEKKEEDDADEEQREDQHSRVLLHLNVLLNTSGSIALKSIGMRVGPTDVFVEDTLVYKLLEYFDTFFGWSEMPSDRPTLPPSVAAASSVMLNQIVMDEIVIEPMDITLTVRASAKVRL